MCGRGIDQILPQPSYPRLYEYWIKDAADYVGLAEQSSGTIPRKVGFNYVWGDAIDQIRQFDPHFKIINLETAITSSRIPWPAKGINYKMNPPNIPLLTAAGISACALSNNHVLDWHYEGLQETIYSLKENSIATAGAGQNLEEAKKPAVLEQPGTPRVLLFSVGFESSGIPKSWAADRDHAGVWFFPHPSESALAQIKANVESIKTDGDLAILSIHWGENWDYNIYPYERQFAHDLIDHAHINMVHGHSSHHIKGIEVYRNHLILYGCGDLINDYEGIKGDKAFRGDISLMYFPVINAETNTLKTLMMVPTVLRKFRIKKARGNDFETAETILIRECAQFGTTVKKTGYDTLLLEW